MIILKEHGVTENSSINILASALQDTDFYGYTKRPVVRQDFSANTTTIDIDNCIVISKENVRSIKLFKWIVKQFTKKKIRGCN